MKEKILLSFVAILLVSVATVRVIFHSNLSGFEKSIKYVEEMQLHDFEQAYRDRQQVVKASNKNVYELFTKEFEVQDATEERDTVYSFMYLTETIKFKKPSHKYLDCLHRKCVVDAQNAHELMIIEKKVSRLKDRYKSAFEHWYSALGEERLFDIKILLQECLNLTDTVFEIHFNERKWKDFEKMTMSFAKEEQSFEIRNKKIVSELENMILSVDGQLNASASRYFKNMLADQKSNLIQISMEQKTFSTESFGQMAYQAKKFSIDRNAFQNIVDAAMEEQWKTNSLSNGAMPYSYCYGSSNYCSDYGCSQIKVISGNSDVLVTIKKNYGKVYRHGYIRAGRSFTFNVADGDYQVFFYSGKGWNPSKVISTSSCGNLKGGFVLNENVTKDSYLSIYNQIMTYELISQQGGNFSAQASSKNEAF